MGKVVESRVVERPKAKRLMTITLRMFSGYEKCWFIYSTYVTKMLTWDRWSIDGWQRRTNVEQQEECQQGRQGHHLGLRIQKGQALIEFNFLPSFITR